MNVLVFTSLYPNNVWPHHGVFIKERTVGVSRLNGHAVKVVAPVPYFPPIKLGSRWRFSQVRRHEVIEGLEVFHPRYLMTPKVGMVSYGAMMFLSVLRAVRQIQREFDFDLIDSHFVYPDGFAGVLLGRVFGKPVVVSARGSDINLYKEFPLIRILLSYTLRSADRVIAVSQSLKGAMVTLNVPENKITVISNGVDRKKFFRFPRNQARNKLGIPDKHVILSVGHLTSGKGFDLLIDACRLLIEDGWQDKIYLIIVGEGIFRKKLEAKIAALHLEAAVRLVGDVRHEELYLWYSAADLFCLASRREGWPNVVVESLACGTPVVATAVGGIPEIVHAEHVGLLVERNSPAIARGITKALSIRWDADTISRAVEMRTWNHVARSVSGVFEAVLAGRLNECQTDSAR